MTETKNVQIGIVAYRDPKTRRVTEVVPIYEEQEVEAGAPSFPISFAHYLYQEMNAVQIRKRSAQEV